MIEVRELTKRYGRLTVLEGLEFGVGRGERVAVLGVNGAGKTTLFRCLLGLTGFDGELSVDGRLAGPRGREARSRIGYVPQLPPVYDLTLSRFLGFFAELREIPSSVVVGRLAQLGLDIDETRDKPMRELSGGMLQKAYLALALASSAPVLLLDEPTASLDPGSRRDFVKLLGNIERETTVLLASHRLEEIEPLAERIVVLDSGRVAFDGTLTDLWERTGMEIGLWLAVPYEHRSSAVRDLRAHPAVLDIHPNGTGIHLQIEGRAHLDVLVAARERGVPVLEFGTHAPPLEDVLSRLTEADAGEVGS